MQYFRCFVVLLLMVAPAVSDQGRNGTSKTIGQMSTDLSISTTDLSVPTTEEDWSPFPAGDVLNNPWLRKIRFCVDLCFNETKLQGLRNLWPYLHPTEEIINNLTSYTTQILHTSKEIAVDPALRAKFYCGIIAYPHWGAWSLLCFAGNSTVFLNKWRHSPIGTLRDNISLSVFNATLAFLSLVFGIFGNILIIVAILTKKELKSSTNLLLLGMAVADCMNSIMIVFYAYLETFLWSITNAVMGPIGCALLFTVKEFTQLAAVNHLIALSFERYFAICWPMKQSLRFTQKKTVLIILFNWILAAVQAIPQTMLIYSLKDQHGIEYFCHKTTIYEEWIRVVYNLTVYLVLPVPILCFNYISVVRSLFSSIKRSREMTGESSAQITTEKARLKLTYMMITLVVIYIILVTPGRILEAFAKLEPRDPQYRTFNFFYFKKVSGSIDLVRGMNSWTNVVVYALISRQFHTAFREILCVWRKPAEATSGLANQNGMNLPPETVEDSV